MQPKLIKINGHKVLGLAIQDEPKFSFLIQQYFIEDMDKFEQQVWCPENDSVQVTLNSTELHVLANFIKDYYLELIEKENKGVLIET